MFRLRQNGRCPARVPAGSLTAYARGEEQNKALESGFQVHIAKPFSAVEFVNAVAALTGKSQNRP